MNVHDIIELSSGLLTPVISIIAIYIAIRQHKVNEAKYRLDLYDRQLRIYEEVKKFILLICQNADAKIEESVEFRSKVSEADFLFKPEINEYIEEIYGQAIRLGNYNRQYRDAVEFGDANIDLKRIVEEKHETLKWLAFQLEPSRKKFAEYLAVRNF